jgi:phosphoglycolate phosphatase-like HAD superfamily hydrolase
MRASMTLDIPRIRALCFDVDGTLRDTDDQYVDQLVRWLRPVYFLFRQRDPQKFARRVIMTLESPGTLLYSLPDRFGFDNHLTSVVELMYRLGLTRRPHGFWIVPNVYEAVVELSKHYPMAVISARDERTTIAFLNEFNLMPLFHCVATAHTCHHTKPYPDPILWAAQQMGVPASSCLMIGDSTVDIRAGKAAGAQTVGVLCGFGREPELRNSGADLILASPAELPSVLLGRDQAQNAVGLVGRAG